MRLIFLLSLYFAVYESFSQEEREFRKILRPKEVNTDLSDFRINLYDIKTTTKSYNLDINSDGFNESFILSKSSDSDFLSIYNHKYQEIYQAKLDASGPYSRLYRISIQSISDELNVLLMYHFEGAIKYLKHESNARIYFITYNKKNLKFLNFKKGPIFYQEHSNHRFEYFKRFAPVVLKDLNNDGVKEIVFKYSKISDVYSFNSKNNDWLSL